MHRLEELVRLHRLKTGAREVARLLSMGPNTERQYREALVAEGLLAGAPEALPPLDVLRAAVEKHLPPAVVPPHQQSGIEAWLPRVETLWKRGVGPLGIWGSRRRARSTGRIRRSSGCAAPSGDTGVRAEDVAIPNRDRAGRSGAGRFRPRRQALRPVEPPAARRVVLRDGARLLAANGRARGLQSEDRDVAGAARRGVPRAGRGGGAVAARDAASRRACGLRPATVLGAVAAHRAVALGAGDGGERVHLHRGHARGDASSTGRWAAQHGRGAPSRDRVDLRHRSRAHWQERAQKMGADVGEYIQEVFDSYDVLSQLRCAQAMVMHLERFPPERARRACLRARHYGSYGYAALKKILRDGIDLEPLPSEVTPQAPEATPRFARPIAEIVH